MNAVHYYSLICDTESNFFIGLTDRNFTKDMKVMKKGVDHTMHESNSVQRSRALVSDAGFLAADC